jgi:holo-[acyl-carrier protein] synthase
MEIFSGIDLVEIDRFRQLNSAIRMRFFKRVFTVDELTYIQDMDQRAAGIFAAKEACAKALGCGIGPINWVEIEISHTSQNQPQICLHGKAKEMALSNNISAWSVSITHTKKSAAAVVIAAVN